LNNQPMIYGYAPVSTDGHSEAAQVRQLRAAGAWKVFREVANGAKTDLAQLPRVLAELGPGDVLMVTRLDRLTRSTRDLLNTLAAITEKKAGLRSLADACACTRTAHGRLMLTVLGGLAEFERGLIRARTGKGRARAKASGQRLAASRSSPRTSSARRSGAATVAGHWGISPAPTTSARARFPGSQPDLDFLSARAKATAQPNAAFAASMRGGRTKRCWINRLERRTLYPTVRTGPHLDDLSVR
jgi:hypothetical protein